MRTDSRWPERAEFFLAGLAVGTLMAWLGHDQWSAHQVTDATLTNTVSSIQGSLNEVERVLTELPDKVKAACRE